MNPFLWSSCMTERYEVFKMMRGSDNDIWVNTNKENVILDFSDGNRQEIYNAFLKLFNAMKQDNKEAYITDSDFNEENKVFRTHDDNDGILSQGLFIEIKKDSKIVCVRTNVSARYRVPRAGGGRSVNTFNALRILYGLLM